MSWVVGVLALADKDYDAGVELQGCQQQNMTTQVAKEQPGVKYIVYELLAKVLFATNTQTATPATAGATLTSLGIWHNKGEANETSYWFKIYRTGAYP